MFDGEDEEYDDGLPEITDEDICWECSGYGDDYYTDESGELVCACDDCPFNPANRDEGR